MEKDPPFSEVTHWALWLVSVPMKESLLTDGKKLATARELAARYGICRRTLTNWVRSGKLHAIKLGRRCLRFDIERADAEVARFTVEAAGNIE